MQPELAIGAIATGGVRVLRQEFVQSVGLEVIDQILEREQRELERRQQAYRGNRPGPMIEGRCVILVDDGLATGSTMEAAVAAVRQQKPGEVVVAVPVAPPDTVERMAEIADAVICPAVPVSFYGIGQFYEDFTQRSDEQVRELLAEAWRRYPPPAGRSSDAA
jgi:putative phosphoribosyl transferase